MKFLIILYLNLKSFGFPVKALYHCRISDIYSKTNLKKNLNLLIISNNPFMVKT